jgi:hypothetical protein
LRRAEALRAELVRDTGLDIKLRITDNTSTIMSLRVTNQGRVARVGLHHLFLDAPPDVRTALASWIKRPRARRAGSTLDTFIKSCRHKIRERAPKSQTLCTQGHVHDLKELYDEVNAAEFQGAVDCPITWGKMPRLTRARRSIRFGSYAPNEHLIRIHPLLDQDFVPRFLVRYIVFHEMLHAHMGIEECAGGRRAVHPPAFRNREKEYGDYDKACAWIDHPRNLKKLLAPYRRKRTTE